MSLNNTPSANRVHIGFFGCRNAGKSSLVNAVTGQDLSVVSSVAGTTTDPVSKAMELLPLGPVLIIDTPGFDDEGDLGEKRIEKTRKTLDKTDIAVMVIDAEKGLQDADRTLISIIKEKEIPYITVFNKCDGEDVKTDGAICVSAKTGKNIDKLKAAIGDLADKDAPPRLIGDKVSTGDIVLLVTPIDEAAPKGRIILPQQQVIRDLLDSGAIPVLTRDIELKAATESLGDKIKMVICDSQVFKETNEIVKKSIPLTSFSILMARQKGFLATAVEGIKAIENLKDGDRLLISEGCTHHRQCNDIGTVKIPRWLRTFTGRDIIIETSSGADFPDDLTPFRAVIHCGGCMLTERQIKERMKKAKMQNVPFINYGTLIAHINGILERSIDLFKS